MSYLLVHASDAARALMATGDPSSEHYLRGVVVDRFGVCTPGNAFVVQESLPEQLPPLPCYMPLAMPTPRWIATSGEPIR